MQKEHIVFLRYFPPNHTQRVVAVDRKAPGMSWESVRSLTPTAGESIVFWY
jgi:hypothetical protein